MSTEQFTQGYTALAMIILQNYALGFELLTSRNIPQGREPTQPTQEKPDKLVPTSEVENAVPLTETGAPQKQGRLKLEVPPKKRKRLPCDGDAAIAKAKAPTEGVSQKRAPRRARKRHRHATPSAEVGDMQNGPEIDLGDSKDSLTITKPCI
ncbi:MAG: hypothetical protein M1840_008912 [Geoglossum simile]|nr:MAG: hypothetical protein M1840_008912 [Geoglossum simile]